MPPFGRPLPLTRLRNATQIWRFASDDRSAYRSETCMRDWNASSNTRTRFVVRKRMPRKYLHTDTGRVVSNVFRCDLCRHELREDSLELSEEDRDHGVPLQMRKSTFL